MAKRIEPKSNLSKIPKYPYKTSGHFHHLIGLIRQLCRNTTQSQEKFIMRLRE